MGKKVIGVLVGSLRKDSYSKRIASYVSSVAPDDLEMRAIDIGGLPVYNQDDDENPSTAWVRLRDELRQVDGFLFVTPEHNRSVPAALKNALDGGSRPYGQSVWNAKPGAIISVSPGRLGGFGANHHLRQVLSFLNVYVLQQPEAYFGDVVASLDDEGNVVDESTKRHLGEFMDSFATWVRRFSS